MNKRKLYESIMASVAKQIKKTLLNESYDNYESMSDIQWLNRYLIDYFDLYIREVYDPVQNYAIYGLSSKADVEEQKERLQENKAINRFRTVGNRNGYYILCFKYNEAKDTERQELVQKSKEERLERERLEREKFEADVQSANTDKYAPTERDWIKMIEYMNGHSNPERVAKSCKDPNKVVARYIIAKALGWKEAEIEFKHRIKILNILSDIELEAYQRKYATYNIPENIKEMIDDFVEYDSAGGFAAQHIEHSEILPDNVKKYIYSNKDIRSYTIELIQQIPFQRRIYSSGPKLNLAKVTFKMIDGTEKDTWFVYGDGYALFKKYRPNIIYSDEIGKGAYAVHSLEHIFEK